jgi:hypothetical protein
MWNQRVRPLVAFRLTRPGSGGYLIIRVVATLLKPCWVGTKGDGNFGNGNGLRNTPILPDDSCLFYTLIKN